MSLRWRKKAEMQEWDTGGGREEKTTTESRWKLHFTLAQRNRVWWVHWKEMGWRWSVTWRQLQLNRNTRLVHGGRGTWALSSGLEPFDFRSLVSSSLDWTRCSSYSYWYGSINMSPAEIIAGILLKHSTASPVTIQWSSTYYGKNARKVGIKDSIFTSRLQTKT